MDKNTMLQQQHKMLSHLSTLPRKILSLHNHDNVTELVLHTLCGKQCFDLKKAAYFVDNPDFNCLKGVSGFYHNGADTTVCCGSSCDENKIADQIKDSAFNKKVRSIERCSIKKGIDAELAMAYDIAHDLDISNPQICLWNMKHDNHGLLIFEKGSQDQCHYSQDHVENGFSLLAFCPIY